SPRHQVGAGRGQEAARSSQQGAPSRGGGQTADRRRGGAAEAEIRARFGFGRRETTVDVARRFAAHLQSWTLNRPCRAAAIRRANCARSTWTSVVWSPPSR